jgi:Coenzyme PQQ synthesis protein D (PqqD)
MAVESHHLQTIIDQDGAVILDIERGRITTLNITGAFVWQRINQGEVLDSIAAELARETGEDPLTVERDVREFVDSLRQSRLLPSICGDR